MFHYLAADASQKKLSVINITHENENEHEKKLNIMKAFEKRETICLLV